MCGIFGWVGQVRGGASARDRLDAMARALAHRGPDGTAFQLEGPAALGMTRLAIVAPREKAAVAHHAGAYAVLNGEIYNHAALRTELKRAKAEPTSKVDTALLPVLWRQFGPGMFGRMRGPHALALWDKKEKSLHLLRDPMGEKPLYFCRIDGGVAFASEQKALVAGGFASPAFRADVAERFLRDGMLDEDDLLLADVEVLPPGAWLTADGGGVSIQPGHHPYAQMDDDPSTATLVERMAKALQDAVAEQVKAGRKVGTLISGGMDSTLVALLARAPAFTVDVPGSSEAAESRAAAKRADVEHEVISVPPPSRERFRRALWHLEQPDARTTWSMGTHLMGLAEALRKRGTIVVLGGEGADELFLGYPWHRTQAALEREWKFPTDEAVLNALGKRGEDRLALATARLAASGEPAGAQQAWMLAAEGAVSRRLEEVGVLSQVPVRRLMERRAPHAARRRQLRSLTRDMLALPILHADRLLMAHGVEARLPFLDPRVVSLALRAPAAVLEVDGAEKPLLREVARKITGWRTTPPKHGFTGAPHPAAPEVLAWARDLLAEGSAVVDGTVFQRLQKATDPGDRTSVAALWRLVVLEESARAMRGVKP